MESTQYIILETRDQKQVKVSREITKMSATLNSAVDEIDFENGNEPVVPCFMVDSPQINLIVEYCSHFNFERDFDSIPIPIPKGDKALWITDPWELNFIS